MDEEILAKVKKALIIGSFFGLALVFFFLKWHAALIIYVLVVGLFATLAILIQSGKGGGLAASLGGLGGESLLGVRSATPIAKATYFMLGLFIFICMLTAIMGTPHKEGKGLLETTGPAAQPLKMPELPAGGTVPPVSQPAPAAQPPAAQPSPAAPSEKPSAEAPAAPAKPAPAAPNSEGNTQP